jgi:hypothetical protein
MIMDEKSDNERRNKYFELFKEIQKIVESPQDEIPKLGCDDKVPELEYVPRGNFIICTGSIVPGTETAIIKYEEEPNMLMIR